MATSPSEPNEHTTKLTPFAIGIGLLRNGAFLLVLYLVCQKAETDFQVALVLVLALMYRGLVVTPSRPETGIAQHLHDVIDIVDWVTSIAILVALLIVVLR